MQARLLPEDNGQEQRAREMGLQDPHQLLMLDDLVRGDDVLYVATAITDTDLLDGVHYGPQFCSTHSVVMRSLSGTVRFVRADHQLNRKWPEGRPVTQLRRKN